MSKTEKAADKQTEPVKPAKKPAVLPGGKSGSRGGKTGSRGGNSVGKAGKSGAAAG